ncbi:MAG: DNA/RNA non-specific endonuclease [Prevotella sp.]|nr:DNA/RNA non-specific endonuclease [Prevotella sp.]
MKRIYIQPTIETYQQQNEVKQTVSSGLTGDGNVVISGGEEAADADGGCSRGTDLFDDILVKVLLVLVMMTTALFAQAQSYTEVSPVGPAPDGKTHAMRITLKSESIVEYGLEALDHVTYLPGIGVKVYLKSAAQSVDYLYSQMTKIEYAEDGNSNANWEKVATLWTNYPEAWRLEYPQLSYNNLSVSKDGAETKNQIIVKRTVDYGITYSLEWDNSKVANRWTCYQLHAGNSLSAVSRNDDFKADAEVAVSSTLSQYSGSGFSRGHLCPSADRLCSTEQNKQTFFLTNMQPQYQSHNGGLWGRLEAEVRNYATDDSYTASHCDTLYIVKAATISDKVTINETEVDRVYSETCKGLIIPKYFYMALLHYNKDTDTYHALAFWTNHTDENQSVKYLGDYAISIDELEKRTGIDFFCNLPDYIENAVESTLDLDFWHLTTSPAE